MKKIIIIFFFFFGLLGIFITTNIVLAQDFGTTEIDTGLEGSLAAGEDIRVTIGRLIQFTLGFLGVFAVGFIMYAGFLWMTSGGNEEKISIARKILINSSIGLVIILSSFAVATFILRNISDIIGSTEGGATNPSSRISDLYNAGSSAIGDCSVASIYPADKQRNVPRNTSILITFQEALSLSNVCVNDSGANCNCDNSICNKVNPKIFRLFKSDLGDACQSDCPAVNTNVTDIKVSVTSDKKTLILAPLSYLGSTTNHTDYSFNISGDLKKENNSSMFSNCRIDRLGTTFTVSDVLDFSPPFVQEGKTFPLPDNEKDLTGVSSPAVAASAVIRVIDCPQAYSPATILSVSPAGPNVSLEYQGNITKFKVSVPADNPTKAQLFNGENDVLLGTADWNSQKEAVFSGFLTIEADQYSAGSIWEINISPEVLADTLRINNEVYTFSNSSVNNNIKVVEDCNSSSYGSMFSQAANIQAVISGHEEISSTLNGTSILLKSRVLGASGNNIAISSNGSPFININPFTGGADLVRLDEVRGRADNPRNTAIQFVFNESINPITVSGSANEVSPFVRVLNNNKEALRAGATCSSNANCLSYKCDNSVCVGNYLNGRFTVSNNYRTVEFLSNEECGLNGCGEKIYCLPANSNLKVEINAANLKTCLADTDCLTFSPYSKCSISALGYSTCQSPDVMNHPLANISSLDGIVDTAYNSLDGNRNNFSAGPLSFYNENLAQKDFGDSYSWSFFINDEINLAPPIITYITPIQGQDKVSLAEPIEVRFNKLMLNNTLNSGSVNIFNGQNTFNHKLVNLKSATPVPLGFWISSDNVDNEPFDGQTDFTKAVIEHTPFTESMTFSVQVGSGVKDIYQNCYKPSTGPGCLETDGSCCFGFPTAELDGDGNCIF